MTSTVITPPTDTEPDPGPGSAATTMPPARGTRSRRLWRGPETDPSWARPALWGLLALAAVLYTWNLSANGLSNSYYSAAVRSATVSWKAMLFGAIDPAASITVDKPPMAIWLMGLSGRLFGFSTLSMLLPEALAGVASVAVVWRLVKQWSGPVAALFAGLAFALTPAAVLMFRINDPDALLTLLMLLGVWGVWSALERDGMLPLVLAGSAFGAAFLTKMLAGIIVVPALALVYLVCSRASVRARIGRLLAAGVAFLVTAGWWVALTELWPAATRPFIGGSTNNSVLDLVFGYNGLQRVFGGSGGPGGGAGPGGGGGPNFGGVAGWLRMFNTQVGGQASWLLPLAAAGVIGGLGLAGRAPRTDRLRTGFLVWAAFTGSQLVVFSLAKGIFHPYYVVALAPGIAALAGAGVVALWRLGARSVFHAWLLPLAVTVSGVWAYTLLHRTPDFAPWLAPLVLVGTLVTALALGILRTGPHPRAALAVTATVAAVALLAGPTAYALDTVSRANGGGTPSAGPAASTGGFGVGGFGGGAPGAGGGTDTTDSALVSYLESHRGGAKYLAAAFGSMGSASIIADTGESVLTIGGFSGSDAFPTLAQFEKLVSTGQVRYVIVSGFGGGGGPGGGGPGGGGGGSSAITQWVQEHGTTVDYGGSTTLYRVGG